MHDSSTKIHLKHIPATKYFPRKRQPDKHAYSLLHCRFYAEMFCNLSWL